MGLQQLQRYTINYYNKAVEVTKSIPLLVNLPAQSLATSIITRCPVVLLIRIAHCIDTRNQTLINFCCLNKHITSLSIYLFYLSTLYYFYLFIYLYMYLSSCNMHGTHGLHIWIHCFPAAVSNAIPMLRTMPILLVLPWSFSAPSLNASDSINATKLPIRLSML